MHSLEMGRFAGGENVSYRKNPIRFTEGAEADIEGEGVYKVRGGTHTDEPAGTSNRALGRFLFRSVDLSAPHSVSVTQEFHGLGGKCSGQRLTGVTRK